MCVCVGGGGGGGGVHVCIHVCVKTRVFKEMTHIWLISLRYLPDLAFRPGPITKQNWETKFFIMCNNQFIVINYVEAVLQ